MEINFSVLEFIYFLLFFTNTEITHENNVKIFEMLVDCINVTRKFMALKLDFSKIYIRNIYGISRIEVCEHLKAHESK